MQPKTFLVGSFSLPVVPAAYLLPNTEPDKEPVKLYLVGSLRGIASITHSLHSRGFAEVNDWSKPQPTGLPGEYVTVLVRQVTF
jgi:hypothetical protein